MLSFGKALGLAAMLLGSTALSACSSNDQTSGGGDAGSGGRGNGSTSGGGSPSTGGHSSSGGSDAGGGGGNGAGGGGSALPIQVGTGEYETFYLVDGVIYGYGAGSSTLGQGSYQGLAIPPRKVATPAGLKFVAVQGGLHQTMAIDENGYVWTWGEADQGLQGGGDDSTNGTEPYKVTVDVDGNPFDHIVGIEPTVANANGEVQYDLALKDDGTVWGWGNLTGGLPGDGTAGRIVEKPTKIPIPLPNGVKIVKVLGSSEACALASDGSVWVWGTAEGNYLGTGTTGATDGYTPQKLPNLPSDIVDLAVGYAGFGYALTSQGALWGWGIGGGYMGYGDGYNPLTTPTDLTSKLMLPHKVVEVACDFMTTHVILDDGTLWGWGDDAMGLVGDGQELDFATTKTPYAWDFGQLELPIWKPVHIAKSVSNFKKIFAHSPFLFYDYAETADGKLYSWGRNKTGTLGNGVYPLSANNNSGTSAQMSASYPNSWDVTTPTLVTPFMTAAKGENSPACVTNPTAPDCD